MAEDYAAQRRYTRVDASVDVRISTIEPEHDPWTGRPFFRASHETCVNVSRGGAFVRTSEPLRPGRRLLVELQLPGGQQVEAIGRVAWARKVLGPDGQDTETGIGVEFLGGAQPQFAQLEAFVESEVQRRKKARPAGAKSGACARA